MSYVSLGQTGSQVSNTTLSLSVPANQLWRGYITVNFDSVDAVTVVVSSVRPNTTNVVEATWSVPAGKSQFEALLSRPSTQVSFTSSGGSGTYGNYFNVSGYYVA